ncbi:MAG TPA: Uma2 family endonuclease [Thermomicrobiales bacterium]|jgi:Uma2 family endonuclease
MVLTAPLDRPLTYDDLVALPDDGKRYELIGGEVFELPSPSFFHQFGSLMLVRLLSDWVLGRQLGVIAYAPLDVRFDPRNTVQPDIIFLSRERLHLLRRGAYKLIDGAPDLLIEILSPFNRGHDFIKKAALYATFGVRGYWIVDPEAETITVQVLRDGLYVPLASDDGIVRSEVLPGFEVDPKGLFALPDWMSDGADDVE